MIVVPYSKIFTRDPQQPQEPNEAPKVLFKGEEVITGSILSVTIEQKPLIVFVRASPRPTLNTARDGYSDVAERLRAMNFEVTEWNPAGRPGPGGRMMPAGPKPTPKPGQTMVFIALHSPPTQPGMPVNPAAQQVSQALQQHIQAGQPAMMFVAPSGLFGGTDTSVSFLKEWGITAETSRIVFDARTTPQGDTVSTPQIQIVNWSAEHNISKAIAGLTGIHISAVPLTLANPSPEGIKVHKLIQTPTTSWGEVDLANRRPTKDAEDSPGPITTAVAAEKGKQRLVVIADPYWSINEVVQIGPVNPFTGQTFSQYPANAELTVNSIYWLAGMDQLIAASPRSQDIRRVEQFTAGTQRAMWWFILAAIPVGCLGAGVMVWFRRRV